MRRFRVLGVLLTGVIWTCTFLHGQTDLPVRDPAAAGITKRAERYPYAVTRNQMLPAHLFRADTSGKGLSFDLGDSTLFGQLHAGPAFFDEQQSDYHETRFRQTVDVTAGRGFLPVAQYFEAGNTINANQWVDRGVLGYRLELMRVENGRPVHHGLADGRVWFSVVGGRVRPVVSICEGPAVNLVVSDHPEWIVVSSETDRPARVWLELEGGRVLASPLVGKRHEIRVDGLLPDTRYRYRVLAVESGDTIGTPWIHFLSAPAKGTSGVVFVYAGDGRAASGGGEYGTRGVNRKVVSRIAEEAHRKGARFFLFGGDLIGGHVNSVEAFRTQLKSFKQAIEPFRHSTAFYSALGNHETLLHVFDNGSRYGLGMDRWPYDTESAEAVFADEFVHPRNGPTPQPGLPPYAETVFSFQYGDVRVIVFNNNYWWTSHSSIPSFGGSPEGYILPEQLSWIEHELQSAEVDSTVRHILLLAQEPVFPGGGHVGDAMWHNGDNTMRAFQNVNGAMVPSPMGIVDVRNRLWEMICRNPKVAAVLGSDEHNYQRMLITNNTPVGVPSEDDIDGDGKLRDGKLSPNPGFVRPTWFIISGGAGAPYYTQQHAPWNSAVLRFTPQSHYVLFSSETGKLKLQAFSAGGQLLDEVDDLVTAGR